MAFVATDSTTEPRAFSVGPVKFQILTYTAASGDTSGTITADKLASASHLMMDGALVTTGAPTISGNVITIAFNDPVATVFGTILVVGK